MKYKEQVKQIRKEWCFGYVYIVRALNETNGNSKKAIRLLLDNGCYGTFNAQ